jgi:hypothetical protein
VIITIVNDAHLVVSGCFDSEVLPYRDVIPTPVVVESAPVSLAELYQKCVDCEHEEYAW